MTRVKVTGKLADHMRNKKAPGIVVPMVKDMLMSKYGPDLTRDQHSIHPSEMAKNDWCIKATYHRIVGDIEPKVDPFDFGRQNIFAEGNTIHSKWQKWLADTGKLWGLWECRFCHEEREGTSPPDYDWIVNEDWPDGRDGYCPTGYGEPLAHWWKYHEVPMQHGLITGHSDGALLDEHALIEIKSIGLGTLRIDAPELLQRYQEGSKTDLTGLWRAIERPLKSHLRQGDVYLWLANKVGLPFDRIVYLYEFKANQQVKEFTITYDEGRVQPLIDKAMQIEYAVEHREAPECSVSQQGCDQCRARVKKKRNVVR